MALVLISCKKHLFDPCCGINLISFNLKGF